MTALSFTTDNSSTSGLLSGPRVAYAMRNKAMVMTCRWFTGTAATKCSQRMSTTFLLACKHMSMFKMGSVSQCFSPNSLCLSGF